MHILVTGGAGYIGSHVVVNLLTAGHSVVVVDDLSKGHPPSLRPEVPFIRGDIGDSAVLDRALAGADAVVHLAASSLVGESMEDPGKYYLDNVVKGRTLLEAMVRHGVKKMVFSSSAAVYGEPEKTPIAEDHPCQPTNPYGHTKLVFEGMLKSYERAYGLRHISLRYFNAGGANGAAGIGEDHTPETHLIPIVLQVASGKRAQMAVFGDDYATKDGTCMRDYIHVDDLAAGHRLALESLNTGGPSTAFNLGNGAGFSVLEVINMVEQVTGIDIPYEIGARRAGDPAVLVASSDRIRAELGWNPRYPDLESIVATAWEWHRAHPEGYLESKTKSSPAPLDLEVEDTTMNDGRRLIYYKSRTTPEKG